MARDTANEPSTGASGRHGLAVFRDDDWEDFVAAVHDLPRMARDEGTTMAIAWGRTELPSLLSLFDLSVPNGPTAVAARAAVATFFQTGVLRLMCDGDRAGFLCRVDFLAVVHHELFGPSVRAVFERSAANDARPYLPLIPAK